MKKVDRLSRVMTASKAQVGVLNRAPTSPAITIPRNTVDSLFGTDSTETKTLIKLHLSNHTHVLTEPSELWPLVGTDADKQLAYELVPAASLEVGNHLLSAKPTPEGGEHKENGAYIKAFLLFYGTVSYGRSGSPQIHLRVGTRNIACEEELFTSAMAIEPLDATIFYKSDANAKPESMTLLLEGLEQKNGLLPWLQSYRVHGLPEEVWEWDLETKYTFASGLLDARLSTESVGPNNQPVHSAILVANRGLAEDIHVFLTTVGIRSRISQKKVNGKLSHSVQLHLGDLLAESKNLKCISALEDLKNPEIVSFVTQKIDSVIIHAIETAEEPLPTYNIINGSNNLIMTTGLVVMRDRIAEMSDDLSVVKLSRKDSEKFLEIISSEEPVPEAVVDRYKNANKLTAQSDLGGQAVAQPNKQKPKGVWETVKWLFSA